MQVDIDTTPGQAGFVADDVRIDEQRESGLFHGVDRSKPLFRGDEEVDVGGWPQCRIGIDDLPDMDALDDSVADAFCLKETIEFLQGGLLGHVGNSFRNSRLLEGCAGCRFDGMGEAMLFKGVMPTGRQALAWEEICIKRQSELRDFGYCLAQGVSVNVRSGHRQGQSMSVEGVVFVTAGQGAHPSVFVW